MSELTLHPARMASPSFEAQYREFEAEWEDEEEKPYYLALSEYAIHIYGLLKDEDQEAVARVFATVERLLAEGDDYVRRAVLWGFIEDLQNHLLRDSMALGKVKHILGPLAGQAWEQVKEYWEKGMS